MVLRKEITNSTAIRAFEYDTETRILRICFTSNDNYYDYPNLPEELVRDWMESIDSGVSAGKFYNQQIRNYG